jgi:hypothetical protein
MDRMVLANLKYKSCADDLSPESVAQHVALAGDITSWPHLNLGGYMSTKQTEWKTLSLTKDQLDFSKALHASLESDGDNFISLTFKLKCGRIVRIRKNDYSVRIEAPITPMETHYIAKAFTGLQMTFKSREEADNALSGISGEVQEISVPAKQAQLTEDFSDLPF